MLTLPQAAPVHSTGEPTVQASSVRPLAADHTLSEGTAAGVVAASGALLLVVVAWQQAVEQHRRLVVRLLGLADVDQVDLALVDPLERPNGPDDLELLIDVSWAARRAAGRRGAQLGRAARDRADVLETSSRWWG